MTADLFEPIEFFCHAYYIRDMGTFMSVVESSENPMLQDWSKRLLDSHDDFREILGCVARLKSRYKC